MTTDGVGNELVVVGVTVRIRDVRGTVNDVDNRFPFRVKCTTIVLLSLVDLLVVGSLVLTLLFV